MNAIKFLINEHNHVRKMIADISDDSHRESTKRERFQVLCEDLLRHEKMEQTVWYPYLKKNEKLHATIKHLISEEKDASKEIAKLDNITDFAEWEKQFSKFKDDVEHHASEEEQELFPRVEKFLDETELNDIGKEMAEFKKEFTQN